MKSYILACILLFAGFNTLSAQRTRTETNARFDTIHQKQDQVKNGEKRHGIGNPRSKLFMPGTISTLDIGTSFGKDRAPFEANLGFGYLVNPYFSIGIGTGAHLYSINRKSRVLMPLYGELQVIGGTDKYVPLINLRLGYGFDLSDKVSSEAGLYLSPSVGYRIALSYSLSVYLSLGYTFQKHRNIQNEDNSPGRSSQGAVLRFGICL